MKIEMSKAESRKVLGIGKNAGLAELKKAYREIVKKSHPDLFGHDAGLRAIAEERLKRVNLAYKILAADIASPKKPAKDYGPIYRKKKPAGKKAEKESAEAEGTGGREGHDNGDRSLKEIFRDFIEIIRATDFRPKRSPGGPGGALNPRKGLKRRKEFREVLEDVMTGGQSQGGRKKGRRKYSGLERWVYIKGTGYRKKDLGPVSPVRPVNKVKGSGRKD